jgi:hypothetical protein
MLLDKREVTFGMEIADAFNDNFVIIWPKLASKPPNDENSKRYLSGNHPNNMFVTPAIETEVMTIIN